MERPALKRINQRLYKAYRTASNPSETIRYAICGYTGSGKEILRELADHGEQILIWKIAHHKGAVFGGLSMPPQPTTRTI